MEPSLSKGEGVTQNIELKAKLRSERCNFLDRENCIDRAKCWAETRNISFSSVNDLLVKYKESSYCIVRLN